MSLYGDFLKETFDKNIIEDREGFATYTMNDNECYVENVFVVSHARHRGKASYLVRQIEEIAVENGCNVLTTTVNPKIKDPSRSIKVILNYGFEFLSCDENKILFYKRLKNV